MLLLLPTRRSIRALTEAFLRESEGRYRSLFENSRSVMLLVDPASGAQVPAVSQLYLILTSLVFVTLDGHLLLVQVLARSFEVLPLGASVDPGAFRELAMRAGWVLGAGALIALPSVTAMLLVNLAFGVMTRTAPQLNLFAVGFPITLIMGFVVILLSLPGVLSQVEATTTEVLSWALELVGGGG